jgi:hypothetical protein
MNQTHTSVTHGASTNPLSSPEYTPKQNFATSPKPKFSNVNPQTTKTEWWPQDFQDSVRAEQGRGRGVNRFPLRMSVTSLFRALSQGFEVKHGRVLPLLREDHLDVKKITFARVTWNTAMYRNQTKPSSSSFSFCWIDGIPPNALQPFGAYFAKPRFSSPFISRGAPRQTAWQPLLPKGGIMGEKRSIKFSLTMRLPRHCRVL